MQHYRRHITKAEVDDLATRIAACAAFQNDLARTEMLQTIAPEQSYTPHAIVQLLDCLWLHEDASGACERVMAWLDTYPLDLPFAPARLAALHRIFLRVAAMGIGIGCLEECFKKALYIYAEIPTAKTASEWLMTARIQLGSLGVNQKTIEAQQRARQTLLTFCHHLSCQPLEDDEVQQELCSWIAQEAPDKEREPGKEHRANGPFPAYLCLIVKPGAINDHSKIAIDALFFPGGPDTDQCQAQHWEALRLDQPVTVPDIQSSDPPDVQCKKRICASLIAFVQQIENRLPQHSLMIEVCVPDRLWEIGQDLLNVRLPVGEFLTRPLMAKYCLNLRLTERMGVISPDQTLARTQHCNHWCRWKNQPVLDSTTCHWVEDSDACEPQKLFDAIDRDDVRCVIGLVQPRDPAGVALAIREAGTPIALWGNGLTSDGEDLRGAIESLLLAGRDLPNAIHNLRKEARRSNIKSHPGHHLILLWDNPNRPPSALLLQPLQ